MQIDFCAKFIQFCLTDHEKYKKIDGKNSLENYCRVSICRMYMYLQNWDTVLKLH